jgi:hypothetical protein
MPDSGCLVPLPAGVSHAGIEPVPEHTGVRLQEHVQDLLARLGQAAEDLGPRQGSAPIENDTAEQEPGIYG